jgi:hypothetical protein
MMEDWVRQNSDDGHYYVTDPETEPFVFKHFNTTAEQFRDKVLNKIGNTLLYTWSEGNVEEEDGLIENVPVGETFQHGDLEITYVDGFISKPHINKMIEYLLHGFPEDDLYDRLREVGPIKHRIVLPDPSSREFTMDLEGDILYETFVSQEQGQKVGNLKYDEESQIVRFKGYNLNVTWATPEVLYVDDFPMVLLSSKAKEESFKLPIPMPTPSWQTKETIFEGTDKFQKAQTDFLASRHKEYCEVLSGGRNKELGWFVPNEIILLVTKMPGGVKTREGRGVDIGMLNKMMPWLCDILIDMGVKGKLSRFTKIDPDLKIMERVSISIVEALTARPCPIKRIQLLGVAAFLYHYNSRDFQYAEHVAKKAYTAKEIEAEFFWFSNFKIKTPRRFSNSEFSYQAEYPHLYEPPDYVSEVMKCEKSKFVLLGVISWQYDVKIDQSSKIPLSKGKYTNGHANLLLYDRETNTVERFDSNVDTSKKGSELYAEKQLYLDDCLARYFSQTFAMEYLSPLDWCPSALQVSQERELTKGNVKGKISGFCQAWAFWYADLRLSNPDFTRDQVIELAMAKLKQRPETLTEYIISYAKQYEQFL